MTRSALHLDFRRGGLSTRGCSGEAAIKVDEEYHGASMGTVMGIGCSLGSGVLAQPGVILGNHCVVQAMKMIGGRFPDRRRVF